MSDHPIDTDAEAAALALYAETGLFDAIVERCVEPGAMCMSHMMSQHNAVAPSGQLAQSGIDGVCIKPPVSVEANHAKQH